MSARTLAVNVFLKGFDTLSGPLRAIAGTSIDAKDNIRGMSDEVRKQKGELADLRAEMKKAGGGTDEMIARERSLSDQLARTTKQLDLQKAAQKRLESAKRDADKGMDAGMKNLAVGAGLAAPLILAGKATSDLQDNMTDIRQVANLTANDTARLEDNIFNAAHDAAQLPDNMLRGVNNLLGAGLDDPKSALKMMAPIGRAATAYRAEIDDLSRASFSVYDNLKVPLEETGRALDIMAAGGKAGKIELRDMAQYFPMLTAGMASMKQTGVPALADMTAALEISAKTAGDAGTAANNLNNLLLKAYSPEAQKNFKEMGIDLASSLDRAGKEGKSKIETLVDLVNKATKGNDTKVSNLFQDQQAQMALKALMQHTDEYRAIRAEITKASGTVDADFNIRMQNLSAQTRIGAGDVQRVATVIGEQLMPEVLAVTGPLKNLADGFANWSVGHKTAAGTLAKLVVGIAAFNLVLGAGRVAWASTVVPLTKLYNGFVLLKNSAIVAQVWAGASSMIGGAMTVLRGGLIAGAQGVWTFTAALLANPVTWIVVAIVAAVGLLAFFVYELIKHWDKVGPWLSNLWGNVKSIFMTGVRGALDIFLNFTPLGILINNWGTIGPWLSNLWGNVQSIFMTGVSWALKAFLNFTPLGWVIQSLQPALNWLAQIDMLGMGKNLIDGLIKGITDKWDALKSTIKKVADGAANWFKDHLGIHSPSRVFMDFGGNIVQGLSLGVKGGMAGPVAQVARMADGVRDAMKPPPVWRLASTVTGMMQEPPPTVKRMTRAAGAAATVGMAAMGAAASSVYIAPGAIVIHAAPGQDAQDIARAVRDELARHADEQAARKRSSYEDDAA